MDERMLDISTAKMRGFYGYKHVDSIDESGRHFNSIDEGFLDISVAWMRGF